MRPLPCSEPVARVETSFTASGSDPYLCLSVYCSVPAKAINSRTNVSRYSFPRDSCSPDHLDTSTTTAVVVPNLSRLSRDRKERLRLLLDVDQVGVQLHSVELGGAVDLDDDWELVQQSIHATTNDVEKRKEITRSQRATQERLDNDYDHGRPPVGLTYDDNGHYWVPDRNTDEYQAAPTCIRLRENNHSWREISRETGVNKDTARRIYARRERYRG
jgi:DNA invertase Pin-like site-specific DNA recombinase